MEVTYQLERQDYLDYSKFVIGRVPTLRRQFFLQMIVIPTIIAVDLWFMHITWVAFALIVLVQAVIWNAFLFWARRRAVIAQTAARPGAIGLHTLALILDGVREQTSVIEALVRWTKVTEIAESAQLIVLFFSPRYGFIVPKRAFPTAEGAQAFLETARAYQQSALNGTTSKLPELSPAWPPAPQRINN